MGETRQFYTRGEALWSLFDGRFKNRFGAAYTDVWNLSRVTTMPSSTNEGIRDKYNWLGEFALVPGHILLGGADYQTDRMHTRSSTSTIQRSVSNTGAFAELQSDFAKRFFVAANVRFDDNETFGQHTTWRVAPAVILPATETKLKATAGTGFRAPSLNQLYVSFLPFFVSNPDLKPETSFGYDFGFEQPLPAGLSFGVTYFHNDLDNLIAGAPTGDPPPSGCSPGCTTVVNIAKARTYGTESFISWVMTDRFRVRLDHTYTKAIDTSKPFASTLDAELLRRPRNKFSVQTVWQPLDPLTITSTVIWVSSWVDGTRELFTRIDQPGYTLVNIAAEYAVNRYATVFARLENAFGETYEIPNGYRAPGFGAFGGIRVANR